MTLRLRALVAPRMLGLHLLAIVLTSAAALLGLWQYDVWQLGRENTAAQLANAPAKPLNSVLPDNAPFPNTAVGQPVTFRGEWVPQSTLLVSDRSNHGRTGVWAVTPVTVCGSDTGAGCASKPAILVVRGWAPTVSDVPAAPSGPVSVTGWLQPDEGSGPDPTPGDKVLPALRIADAMQYVEQNLYGGYVIAKTADPAPAAPTGTHAAALQPVTPESLPAPSSFTSLRNLLYAFEWWVFGGFAVFLWWRWCRDEVARVPGVPSDA